MIGTGGEREREREREREKESEIECERECENQENPCCQHDLMMMMTVLLQGWVWH